ncbi:hypothetical protein ACNQGB_01000 [Flavobacterium sp. XS1P32]|uniref:hypothetical protein n=1 Tax=unclassified Flavobacterium TaxID=196869 RepID=UPI003AAA6B09
MALPYFISFYLFSNILKFFLTNCQRHFLFLNLTIRVKDGSGALLWTAFFWLAVKSGNEQPDAPQRNAGAARPNKPNILGFWGQNHMECDVKGSGVKNLVGL